MSSYQDIPNINAIEHTHTYACTFVVMYVCIYILPIFFDFSASEVRGFDLLRGLDSVDLFDAVDQKISDFSEDADQKSSDFSEEALDEMMRDLAEPAETRDTDDIASLKKLIDLLKVMDAKN